MKTFKDNEGQVWVLSLTLSKVRKIAGKLGLDLLNPQHYLQVLDSLTDRMAFVFLLCEHEAKSLDISVDQFEERLYGDGIANEASMAFLAECELLFRKLGQKPKAELTKRVISMMRELEAKEAEMQANGQADSMLDAAEAEIMGMLRLQSVGSGSPS